MGTLTVSGAGRATQPVGIPAINESSWDTISEVSQAGKAANCWSVGDTKTITIDGTVGNTTFSGLSIDVFILGFDHNSAIEGSNTIHFKIGKISGTHVALYDSKYGASRDESTGYFSMNTTNTNSGGWESCNMRNTLLGNSGTPTSPPAGSLLAALPSDLRAVMKAVKKYSDNTGGGSDNASYVTSTTDYLFLLAEFEFFGERTGANSAEQNYQAQYDYYKAGNSKIHYKHDDTSSAINVLCRSVNASMSNNFRVVSDGGSSSLRIAGYSWGLSPAFVV